MNVINNILKMSVADRLLLVEQIWNSIPAEDIQYTQAQQKELDKRLARMKKGETKFIKWEEAKAKLHGK